MCETTARTSSAWPRASASTAASARASSAQASATAVPCFPKDSLALKQLRCQLGLSLPAPQLSHRGQRAAEAAGSIGKLQQELGTLRGKVVTLLGLAFKPNTDDTREAPSLVLAGRPHRGGSRGARLGSVSTGSGCCPRRPSTRIRRGALEGADAAVLVTESPQPAQLDWRDAGSRMRRAFLVDGATCDPAAMRDAGFVYDGIGRAAGR